jgi:hypothetical protein
MAMTSGIAYNASAVLQATAARRAGTDRPGVRLAREVARELPGPLGVAIGLAAWGLQLAALRRAPLAVVQPAMGVGIGVLILDRWRSDGRVSWRDLIGLLAYASGLCAILLVVPASHARPTPGPAWAALAGLTALAGVGWLLARRPLAARAPGLARPPDPPATRGWVAAGTAGLAFTASALTTNAAAHAWGRSMAALALAVALTGLMGAVGTLSELAALRALSTASTVVLVSLPPTVLPVIGAPWVAGQPWPGGSRLWSFGAGLALIAAGVGLVVGRPRGPARASRG